MRFPSQLLVLAWLLAPASAPAAQGAWGARLGLETGVDTNAARGYHHRGIPPEGPQASPVVSAVGALEGQLQGERTWAAGAYDVGARKFLGPSSTEDTVVQAAQLEGGLSLSPRLLLSVEGRAKDRRGGRRTYTDLTGAGVLTLLPDPRVEVRLRVGGHRFLYHELFASSFGAFEGGVALRYRIDRRHSLTAGGELGKRRYHDGVLDSEQELDTSRRRQDGVLGASVGYSYRGPLAFSVGYSHLAQQSNSFGETVLRHRLSLAGGVRLPWQVMALAQVGVQWALYPDGAYYSSDLVLADDEESQNSLSLKLARPLTPRLDVELHYGLYTGAIREHQLDYLRQVAGVGLTFRL